MCAGKSSCPCTSGLETSWYSSLKPSSFPGLLGSSQYTCMAVWFRTLVKKLGGLGTVGQQNLGLLANRDSIFKDFKHSRTILFGVSVKLQQNFSCI